MRRVKMVASSPTFSQPTLSPNFNPKPLHLATAQISFSPCYKLEFPSKQSASRRPSYLNSLNSSVRPKTTTVPRLSSTNWEFLLSEASPVDGSQEMVVSPSDDGVSTVISALLFIAFIVLSILTIGVIYLGVTDFLQKREREKFEKEEAATKKKKTGRKSVAATRARGGPRGFGQKIEEGDDVDEASS